MPTVQVVCHVGNKVIVDHQILKVLDYVDVQARDTSRSNGAFDDVIYMMLSCKLCGEEFFVGINPVLITIGVYWRMIVIKLVNINFLVN